MTRRERLEARAERLRGWADKREAAASATLQSHKRYRGDHAFNFQPGHIPERARVIRQADRAFESLDKAAEMDSRASGIEAQLRTSVYSDDADAVERLEERIGELEAERDRYKAYNASCKTGAPDLSLLDERQRANVETIARVCAYQLGKRGEVSYTNLSANIRRNRERLKQIKRDDARRDAGERGAGRPMASRYSGTCPDCGGDFERGAAIMWYKLTREAVCAGCVSAATLEP